MGISQVPGRPDRARAPLYDPGESTRLAWRRADAAFRLEQGVGLTSWLISRLHHAARALPVYASRLRSPSARNTRFRLVAIPWPGGIGYPLGLTEGFRSSRSPSPGFACRTLRGATRAHPYCLGCTLPQANAAEVRSRANSEEVGKLPLYGLVERPWREGIEQALDRCGLFPVEFGQQVERGERELLFGHVHLGIERAKVAAVGIREFAQESHDVAVVEVQRRVERATGVRCEPGELDSAEEVVSVDSADLETALASLNVDAAQAVKVIVVKGESEEGEAERWVALVLSAQHTLNDIKAEKVAGIQVPLVVASEEKATAVLGVHPTFADPSALTLPTVVDLSAAALADFVCGGNSENTMRKNANWVGELETADLRNVVSGDASPDGNGTLEIKRGIEVGHIFQLGSKYSEAMNCGVLSETGKHQTLTMGCYGIGVSRIVAAAIEQNHDKFGIKWPDPIAPFKLALIPMNMHKSHRIKEAAEGLYKTLLDMGIEVLFDDRKERPGVMFNDMELIGIPHTIVIGERNLDNQQVEYKNRHTGEKQLIDLSAAREFVATL